MSERIRIHPQHRLAAIGRRTLIKRGVLGSAALSLAGVGGWALWPGRRDLAPQAPLRVLDRATFNIMAMVVEAVVPPDGRNDTPAVTELVDEVLSYAPPWVQGDVRNALRLLDSGLVGMLTHGHGRPFSTLPVAARQNALMRWRDAGKPLLRTAYDALRRLTMAAYYSDLARAAPVGYPGPPFDKPDPGAIEPRAPLSPPFEVDA